MKLTSEQQKQIENSLWVVNIVLKKQGVDYNEDMRQSAIMYMCECLLRYAPDKGVKWTTYAYKNVFLYVKKTIQKENNKKFNECSEELFDLYEKEHIGDSKSTRDMANLMSLCNELEQEILGLKLKGYKQYEITQILNCSRTKINNCIHNIKEKAKRC